MNERLVNRLHLLIGRIIDSGGWGSVTVVIEKGHVAHIVWSVDEKVDRIS